MSIELNEGCGTLEGQANMTAAIKHAIFLNGPTGAGKTTLGRAPSERIGGAGVRPLFVSLQASLAAITSQSRGRSFSDEEKERIRVMIAEGYGARPCSDIGVNTDGPRFAATLAELETGIRRVMRDRPLRLPR